MRLPVHVSALSPFGPIFGKELRTTSRRKRSYMLRVGYLALLLVTLMMAYASVGLRSYGGLAQRAQRQAELGVQFFMFFSMFCVIAMGLVGPVLTSTAIGSERLGKTLPVLLMTPIGTWQIITGKLFSRLLAALTLVGLSLPVLALVRLLGGVELDQMIGVICLCSAFAISSAAIGLFFSTLINRAYAVILLSYATQMFFYAFVPFVLIEGLSLREREHGAYIAAINPVFCTAITAYPGEAARIGADWEWCALGQLILAAMFAGASGLMLRRLVRRAGESERVTHSPDAFIPIASVLQPDPEPAAADAAHAAPRSPRPIAYASPLNRLGNPAGPVGGEVLLAWPIWAIGFLLGMGPWSRLGRLREASDHPVLWREVSRPLLPRSWMRIVAVGICVGILLVLYASIGGNDLQDDDVHIGFAIIFHGLFWLLVSVLSATAIAQEKESDTWTLLLTTPLSGGQVVWGKALGIARRLIWPAALVAAHFLLFVLEGVLHPASLLLVLWVMLAYNSVWIATGLYLSLRMPKATFAVIANLMLAVVLYCVPPVLLYVSVELADVRSGGDELVEQVGWYTPYYYLGQGMEDLNRGWRRNSLGYYNYGRSQGPTASEIAYAREHRFNLPGMRAFRYGPYSRYQGATAWQFTLAVVGFGGLYLMASGLILWRTSLAFDRLVGRAGRHPYVMDFESSEAPVPGTADPPGDTRGGAAAPSAGSYVGIWRRGAAAVVDGVILHGGCAAVGVVAGFMAALIASEEADIAGRFAQRPEDIVLEYLAWSVALSFAAGWLYHAGFESSNRRATPGKSLLGIYVSDAEGRRVSFFRASLRYFAKALSAAVFLLGYLMAGFTRRRQALHDLVAGTLVLQR